MSAKSNLNLILKMSHMAVVSMAMESKKQEQKMLTYARDNKDILDHEKWEEVLIDYEELRNNRVVDTRAMSRAFNLLRAYLKGLPYERVEDPNTLKNPVDIDLIVSLMTAFDVCSVTAAVVGIRSWIPEECVKGGVFTSTFEELVA